MAPSDVSTSDLSTVSTSNATRAVGYLAAAGTVPYLALKVAWLSGATIGFTDAALAVDPSLRIANAITGAMDLVVVGLALALTHSWGRRLPSWLLLIPIWVGTGFLVPITLTLLPAAATGGLMPAESSPFEPGCNRSSTEVSPGRACCWGSRSSCTRVPGGARCWRTAALPVGSPGPGPRSACWSAAPPGWQWRWVHYGSWRPSGCRQRRRSSSE